MLAPVLVFGAVLGVAEPAAAHTAHAGRHLQPDGGEDGGTPIVTGLPREGIAVREGESGPVLLLSVDGEVLHRLDGYSLGWADAPGGLIVRRARRTFELDTTAGEFRQRDENSSVPLSYGVTLASYGDAHGIERNGDLVFGLEGGSLAISYDRDIVTTSDPEGRATAYDLRHSRARRLPRGCQVADRHGPSWYLTCVSKKGVPRIVRWRPGGRQRVLAKGPDGGAWSNVMVSPDGRRFLADATHDCGEPTVFVGSTSGGAVRRIADVVGSSADMHADGFSMLGWSAKGEAVVRASEAFGSPSQPPGIYAVRLRDKHARALYVPPVGLDWFDAVMWTPTLERRTA